MKHKKKQNYLKIFDFKIIHKVFFTFFVTSIFIAIGISSCNDIGQICFEIDGTDCPGAILNNAALALSYRSFKTQYQGVYTDPSSPFNGQWHVSDSYFPGSSPVEVLIQSNFQFGTAGGNTTENYIEGYEINYGFWSKDSYRRYSYKEMFKWKYGRDWVPEDGPISDEQVRQWFIERHRVWRNPLIGSSYWENPRDIRTYQAPLKNVCFEVPNPPAGDLFSKHSFSGEIHFPNGIRCQIDPNPTEYRESFGSKGSPHKKKLQIKKPCAGC